MDFLIEDSPGRGGVWSMCLCLGLLGWSRSEAGEQHLFFFFLNETGPSCVGQASSDLISSATASCLSSLYTSTPGALLTSLLLGCVFMELDCFTSLLAGSESSVTLSVCSLLFTIGINYLMKVQCQCVWRTLTHQQDSSKDLVLSDSATGTPTSTM